VASRHNIHLKKTTLRRAIGFTVVLATSTAHSAQKPIVERERLEEHVSFLSSDELAGRGNGSEGLELAARYVASQFEGVGLVPAGDVGSYFQHFRVMTGKEVGRHTEVSFRYSESSMSLDNHADFELMTFSSAGEISAPLVFAGYGVTAPEFDYDDYGGLDVDGKVVVVLRYVPGHALDRGPFDPNGWHATFVRKAENAISHGAEGVIIVNGPLHHKQDRLIPFGAEVGAERMPVPAMHLRRTYADRLFRASGVDLEQIQREIDEELSPRSFELRQISVDLAVDVRSTIVEVSNVLGYLPPTTPGSSEHLIVGAHYDHLGLGQKGSRDRGASGQVHNGADDNASGVAGVLELARMFADVEYRPRGILFAAFAGEELGLRGSYHYTDAGTRRLEDVVAMINLDMIGRLRHDRLFIGGVDLAPGLEDTLSRFAEAQNLTLSGRFAAESASDHASFIRAGVPALFFFTGLHGDYHKPTDDVQFINFEGMESVLAMSFDMSNFLLRTRERPVLAGRGSELVTRRAAQRAYFGVGVDNTFDGDGVRFSYIADDSPAARAGLRAGDVLLELDGRSVRSGGRAGALIQQRRPGELVSAKIRRDEEILEFKIRLTRWP